MPALPDDTRSDSSIQVHPPAGLLHALTSASAWRNDPVPLTAGSLLVLLLLFACKVLLFRNLEYFGSDMYSFLRMTWSWFQDGVLLYDNVYGYHAAIHGFYILAALFPLTYLFGAYGLFLALFLLVGVSLVAVARLRAIPFSGRLAMVAALLSPISYWILDHPQWGFHPELMYPYLGVILTVALVQESRSAVIAAAVAICLVKEDGAVVCSSILVSYFTVRIFLVRHDPASRRVLSRNLAAALTGCVAVFVAGLATLHVARFLIPHDAGQLLSTVRIGEALDIAWATLRGDGNPEWGERLWGGLLDYALIALSIGFLTGRRALAYSLVAVFSAVPVAIVLAVSAAPYGFGNLMWPPRVATLLASFFGALVAVQWAGRSRTSSIPIQPARVHLELWLAPLALVAASWSLQLYILRSAVDYPIRSRLNLPALISGEGTRMRDLRPEELRFSHCLADQLPDRIRVSIHGPQSPLFHRQDLSFVGIESKALRPPVIRVVLGTVDAGVPYPDGFRLTIGRLAVSGHPEAQQWVAPCIQGEPPERIPTRAR